MPTCANLSALSDIYVSETADASYVWVDSEQDYYVLQKASTLTVDGRNVVAPRAGAPIAGAATAVWVKSSSAGQAAGLYFPTISSMASSLIDLLTVGAIGYVASLDSIWTFDPSSTLAPDTSAAAPLGITVVAGNGGGRWLRQIVGSPKWAAQTAWTINALTGNDENVGSSGSPLGTHSELMRRVGTIEVETTVTVTVSTDIPHTDPVRLSWRIGESGFVRYVGTPTTVASGAFTAATNINAAGNVPQDVTGSTSGISSNVNKRVRTTGGSHPNAVAWIAKDLGANKARTSPFVVLWDGSSSYPTAATPVSVTAGDTYVVETLPLIGEFWCDVEVSESTVFGSATHLSIESLAFPVDRVSTSRFLGTDNAVVYMGCDVQAVRPSSGSVMVSIASHHESAFAGRGQYMWIMGGFLTGGCDVPAGGAVIFQNDTLMQASSLRVQGGVASLFLAGGALGIFDAPSSDAAVQVHSGGIVNVGVGSSSVLYGSGNTGKGINVRNGSRAIYGSTKPVITGTGGDAKVGGTAKSWAQIPYVESTATTLAFLIADL